MEEMNALLARRRKAAEKPEDAQNDDPNSPSPSTRSGQSCTDGAKKPWDRANSADRSMVSRLRAAGGSIDADSLDLDRMKQVKKDHFISLTLMFGDKVSEILPTSS
ncbi:Ena/VASP-like protein [Oryzias melastigma]|uniref:Ena/VASP-like protein n=1 Tax=Oryzias melastigma TaxID=30732 RepID=A0A834F706_ORYME|nr:Ena/VASP-like protein [Oryzias melastigma]